MKLDRNINADGTGKYALLLQRSIAALTPEARHVVDDAIKVLLEHQVLDFGRGEEKEFFVIRLRDRFAAPALSAYQSAAYDAGMEEWAREIGELCGRALTNANQKFPD